MNKKQNLKATFLLFLLGFLGILSTIPMYSKLLSLQSTGLQLSEELVLILTVVQSSILLILMIWLGSTFSRKVGLSAPIIFALARSENISKHLKPQLFPAILGGVIGGILMLLFSNAMLDQLPPEFLTNGEKLLPPWYTKLLYGGITEEILIRWGLMSFFVWCSFRITQQGNGEVGSINYVVAIILSALLFGILHLSVAFALSSEITVALVTYIVLGNSMFGLIAGYLYWKRGLESAIVAHMTAHLTMIMLTNLIA